MTEVVYVYILTNVMLMGLHHDINTIAEFITKLFIINISLFCCLYLHLGILKNCAHFFSQSICDIIFLLSLRLL